MAETLRDGFLDSRLKWASISVADAIEIYKSWNQVKIAELVAMQWERLWADEAVKIILEEIDSLQEPDKSTFLNWFAECNRLIKFWKDWYPLEYIYVVYRSNDYKEGEKRIWMIWTAADLSQYFVAKAMEPLFTPDEFKVLFEKWLDETWLTIPSVTKEMLLEKYTATHFLFTMFMWKFEWLTEDFIDKFQQFRYSLIRDRLFNKKN